MISKEQEEKYIKHMGAFCPYCNSKNMENGRFNMDADYVTVYVTCLDCNKEWEDIYMLSGILEY